MRRMPVLRRDLLVLPLLLACGSTRAARDDDEDVGTSSAALSVAPNPLPPPPGNKRMHGEFVIHNPTNFEVGYSVRWGDGPWKPHKILPRHLRRHWHTLDAQGRAPRPRLQFDKIANDSQVTTKTYEMKFGRVGHSPQTGPINRPINYEFVARGSVIDVVQR